MKIDSVDQVKTILERLVAMMEGETMDEEDSEPRANEPVENESEDTEKSANVIDALIATIHSTYTEQADRYFGGGVINQEERIALSGAIGAALDAYNSFIDDNNLKHLRGTDPYPALYKTAEIAIEINTELLAKSEEKRIAYSVAYPAMPLGWHDTQNDWIDAVQIEAMAHDWMIKSGRYDIHHKTLNVSKEDAVVVESFIAPIDISWPVGNNKYAKITKGSWIVATKFSETMWQRVKAGEFAAYSIRGRAKRKPLSN